MSCGQGLSSNDGLHDQLYPCSQVQQVSQAHNIPENEWSWDNVPSFSSGNYSLILFGFYKIYPFRATTSVSEIDLQTT